MPKTIITYGVDEVVQYLKNHDFEVVDSEEPNDYTDGGVTIKIGDRQINIQVGEGYLGVSELVGGILSFAPDVHLFDGVLRQLYQIRDHNATIKEL